MTDAEITERAVVMSSQRKLTSFPPFYLQAASMLMSEALADDQVPFKPTLAPGQAFKFKQTTSKVRVAHQRRGGEVIVRHFLRCQHWCSVHMLSIKVCEMGYRRLVCIAITHEGARQFHRRLTPGMS